MSLFKAIKSLFFSPPLKAKLTDQGRAFLQQTVSFYQPLSAADKSKFEQRCLSFIQVTDFVGHDIEVSQFDKLLVASGSVILAWGFDRWEYVKVDTVILVSAAFNESAEFGKGDSRITGLVGNQHLQGTMILSQPALHAGFNNDQDMRNVAIHEFAHLIDMADGDCDGLPAQITDSAYCMPWLDLVRKGIKDIDYKRSNIRPYGATNQAEFFSVVSEYFFERPKMLKQKHPELYQGLVHFYKQNRANMKTAIKLRKKAPCPCGSGERYKRCCLVEF
ncbi:MAG: zinc-dependent peptidase [Acidiferrobacterales bacterium]|nr:zinc-dependent peptidase [Acidiferrobacterales bacterium]